MTLNVTTCDALEGEGDTETEGDSEEEYPRVVVVFVSQSSTLDSIFLLG